MKVVLLLIMINLLIWVCSIPVSSEAKGVKDKYEKIQRLKNRFRDLEQKGQIFPQDEDPTSSQANEIPILTPPNITPITTSNTTLMPSDEITLLTLPINTNTKPREAIQLLTYGNFYIERTSLISEVSTIEIGYHILIYYHNRAPAKVITMILRVYIRVPKLGRVLQEKEYNLIPEDVEVKCTLKGEGTSEGICSYECSGNTKQEAFELSNAKVNTNEKMKLDGEPAKSEELAFTGQAIAGGEDLIANNAIIDTSAKFLTLTDGRLTNKLGNTFDLEGIIDDFNHKSGDALDFNFIHLNDRTNKIVECKVADSIEKVDDNKSKVTFNCGPYSEFLNSTLDFAIGTFKEITFDTVILNIAEDSGRTIVLNNPNLQNQLSGIAIAGFVVIAFLLSLLAFVLFSFLR